MSAESSQTPDVLVPAERRKKMHLATRLGVGALTSCVVLAGGVVADSVHSGATEPYIAPKIVAVEKGNNDIPALDCEDADTMVLMSSSMGMDIAGYMGRNIVEIANGHNACVRQLEMGTYYDDHLVHQIAQDIRQAVNEAKPHGEKMNLMVWAESWGTNLMQRVLNELLREGTENIEIRGFIIESPPSGEESVNGLLAKGMLGVSRATGFKFGKYTLGVAGSAGMVWQYWGREDIAQTLSQRVPVAWENNEKTSPRLVGDQTNDIAVNGYPRAEQPTDNTTPVFAVFWVGDPVVNNEVAEPEIRSRLKAPMEKYVIDSEGMALVNHAGCWAGWPLWDKKCAPVLKVIFDRVLPESVTYPRGISQRPR